MLRKQKVAELLDVNLSLLENSSTYTREKFLNFLSSLEFRVASILRELIYKNMLPFGYSVTALSYYISRFEHIRRIFYIGSLKGKFLSEKTSLNVYIRRVILM